MKDDMATSPSAAKSNQTFSWSDFVWGVSTSSYQIEGATNEGGRGPSIWDSYCRQVGRIANGDTGDIACDHYHRYQEDVGLMRELGVKAYRFSVAWPRVLPKGRGAANEAGLAFYDRVVDALFAAGIEPWLCLYHWDLPQALDDLGGWTNRDCALWFADYAALIARRYGDRVKRFATFNEPSVFTLFGFCMGGQAPGIVDHALLLRAIHHVNLGHGGAIDVLRANVPEASLGIIHNRQPCRPASELPQDLAAAQKFDAYWNGAFPDPQLLAHYPQWLAEAIAPYQQPGDLAHICRPVDWFGLNHYSPLYLKADDGNPSASGSATRRPACRAPPWAGRCSRMHSAKHCWMFTGGIGCRSMYWRTARRARMRSTRRRGRATSPDRLSAGLYRGDVRGDKGRRRRPRLFCLVTARQFRMGLGLRPRFGIIYVDYPTQRRLEKHPSIGMPGSIKRLRTPPALVVG